MNLAYTHFYLCFRKNHLKFVFQYVSTLKMWGEKQLKKDTVCES